MRGRSTAAARTGAPRTVAAVAAARQKRAQQGFAQEQNDTLYVCVSARASPCLASMAQLSEGRESKQQELDAAVQQPITAVGNLETERNETDTRANSVWRRRAIATTAARSRKHQGASLGTDAPPATRRERDKRGSIAEGKQPFFFSFLFFPRKQTALTRTRQQRREKPACSVVRRYFLSGC
ncbi:hypothetical protein HPB51_011917 [Rhipicephalus microplus]|uniref:Uncharacterized protein n=1 Tax=Rhipicephalus microplus TaxID=6941 RepID=A0A9J6F1I4_RHIMP|nr:hypothetical protein HPB51_011917 [Rhipicephalus microplus]